MMKGLYSIEEDKIVSYGIAYEGMGEQDNVYEIPDDFSFDKYVYIPNELGNFNVDGIIINPIFTETI